MKNIVDYSLYFFFGGIFLALFCRTILLYKVEKENFPDYSDPFSGDPIRLSQNLFFPSKLPKPTEKEKLKVINMLNALRVIYWMVWLQFLIVVLIGAFYGYS